MKLIAAVLLASRWWERENLYFWRYRGTTSDVNYNSLLICQEGRGPLGTWPSTLPCSWVGTNKNVKMSSNCVLLLYTDEFPLCTRSDKVSGETCFLSRFYGTGTTWQFYSHLSLMKYASTTGTLQDEFIDSAVRGRERPLVRCLGTPPWQRLYV